MSDGMIYLVFLISWLLMLGAMGIAHRGDKREAFKAGVKYGREDERARIAWERNCEAQWGR